MKISQAITAVVLAGTLSVPVIGHSKVENRPDTPNVVVTEIGSNWIKIQSIGKEFDTNLHMHEVQTLGDYTCGFWSKKAVLMSHTSSAPDVRLMTAGIPQVVTFYFLVACAIP